jgi:hypothetical protein
MATFISEEFVRCKQSKVCDRFPLYRDFKKKFDVDEESKPMFYALYY